MHCCALPGNVSEARCRQSHARARATVSWTREQALDAEVRASLGCARSRSSIGYVVAMLCSPLAIGVHGEAIGIDRGNRSDMHY